MPDVPQEVRTGGRPPFIPPYQGGNEGGPPYQGGEEGGPPYQGADPPSSPLTKGGKRGVSLSKWGKTGVPLTKGGKRRVCLALLPAGLLAAGCAASGPVAEPVYFPAPPAQSHVVHLVSFNRLDELVPVRGSWMDVFRGQPVRPFVGTPAGIDYRDGHLYVCDSDANIVHDWDLATGRARRLGDKGETALSKPVDVAAGDNGTVYVADTGRGEVVAFEVGGAARRFVPPDREGYKPAALAVGDGMLYVADLSSHQVDLFSASDGARLGGFGGTGSEDGKFYYPMGVATAPGGDVLVSDSLNGRVQVFDAQRNPLRSIGGLGDRYGDMGRPRHVAVGPDETVFVADTAFAHVHLFNMDGQLLMLLGGADDAPGGTPMPVGVAVAPSLPEELAALVPADFDADYFLFTTNSVGRKRLSLYAVGLGR